MSSNNPNELPIDTQNDKIPPKGGFFDMFEKTVNSLAGMKNYLSFVLTLICILGALALAWFKGASMDMLLPSLLGIYVLGRTGQKGMAYFAASKDDTADTRAVIQDLDGIKPPKIQD